MYQYDCYWPVTDIFSSYVIKFVRFGFKEHNAEIDRMICMRLPVNITVPVPFCYLSQ